MLREDDTLDVPSYEVVEGVEVIIFIYIEIVYWHLKTIKYISMYTEMNITPFKWQVEVFNTENHTLYFI